jgi:hypothetical protein
VRAAPTIALSLLSGACGTASFVPVHSYPEGARIYVQGVDTGAVTPATIDLEDFARDPDHQMSVEVRMDGFVSTFAPPFPRRHRCDQWICEHKRRQYLPCHLPLFADGTGIRVDTRREGYEVSVNGGTWLPVDGPALHPESSFGVTVPTVSGEVTFRWRPRDPSRWRGMPEQTAVLRIPPRSWVAVDFDLSQIYGARPDPDLK